jgi:hypothetical protein
VRFADQRIPQSAVLQVIWFLKVKYHGTSFAGGFQGLWPMRIPPQDATLRPQKTVPPGRKNAGIALLYNYSIAGKADFCIAAKLFSHPKV